jgi:hypothetical protein
MVWSIGWSEWYVRKLGYMCETYRWLGKVHHIDLLRHEQSSLARTLGSWLQIPLEAWMSVCVYSVLCCSVCR